MKLRQKIIVDKNLTLHTLMSDEEDADLEALSPEIELSFYPFNLQAFSLAGRAKLSLSEPLYLTLDMQIIDDEQKKPIFSGLSECRSILLISEFINTIYESIQVLGLKFMSLRPHDESLSLCFSSFEHKDDSSLIGALSVLRILLDTQLFVRGLRFSKIKFHGAGTTNQVLLCNVKKIFEYNECFYQHSVSNVLHRNPQ